VECVTLLTVLGTSDSATISKPSQSRIYIGNQAHEDDDQSLQPKSNEPLTDETLTGMISEHETFDDMSSSYDQPVLMSILVCLLQEIYR
jgi:hypothetical protein